MSTFMTGSARIENVFVYGTLMKNFWNYKRLLEGRVKHIIPGKTCGLLYHLNEGYPAMLPGDEIVRGEIIGPIDEGLLASLDRLEGYSKGRKDNLYHRDVRKVYTDDGKEMLCWVYIYADEEYARTNGILVPDGDWRKYMEAVG